jgi:MoaD family protein
MKIFVRLFGPLRAAVGARQVELELGPDAEVGDLPAVLAERYGTDIDQLFASEEGSFSNLLVLVNGQDHKVLDGAKTRLKEGDAVSLLPPLTGG